MELFDTTIGDAKGEPSLIVYDTRHCSLCEHVGEKEEVGVLVSRYPNATCPLVQLLDKLAKEGTDWHLEIDVLKCNHYNEVKNGT